MGNFTANELQRYARHLSLPQIGIKGQQQLKNTAILCVGAGGIGSPALSYLASAGVGKIGIIDDDVVELSNLQRQILYTAAECGQAKVAMAKQRLLALNNTIEIVTYPEKLTPKNALDIFANYSIVIDGSDNYVTRYLVNDACYIQKIKLISASLFQFSGQLLALEYDDNDSTCYRCLYPAPPPPGLMQNCADAGIVGAVAGILGTLAATIAIKFACNLSSGIKNQLLSFDGLEFVMNKYPFSKDDSCELCSKKTSWEKLNRFDMAFCSEQDASLREITVEQLLSYLHQQKNILLLDVRQEWERAQGYIPNSLHLPLAELENITLIPTVFNGHDAIVCYCSAGIRSLKAATKLQQLGLQNVYSLKGGFAMAASFTSSSAKAEEPE